MKAVMLAAVLAGQAGGADAPPLTDCKVLKSSGTPELDKAACDGILQRGRYRPALDAAGNPVESYSTRNVRWQLPG